MPWEETSVIEERLRFVVLANRGEHGMADLCREFGISRQTGYTWLGRYRAGGAMERLDRSRRPLHSPNQLCAEAEQAIVSLRRRWPDWGAAKIQRKLAEMHPQWSHIAMRTVHRVLDRHQLIEERDRRQPALQRFEREQPNELWQMDFKGPQSLKGSPVGALSILDDHSRYLVALKHTGSTRAEGVKETLQETFSKSGATRIVAGRSWDPVVECEQSVGDNGANHLDHAARDWTHLQCLSASTNTGESREDAWRTAESGAQEESESGRAKLVGPVSL